MEVDLMYKTNDYIKLTRNYLETLVYLEQALKNIDTDILETEQELHDIPIATTKLSLEPGGASELTTVERLSYLRNHKAENLIKLKIKRGQIATHITKLHTSIEKLEPDERDTVKMAYLEGMKLIRISEIINLSERSCRRRVRSAIEHLAIMLFGASAKEDIFFIQS